MAKHGYESSTVQEIRDELKTLGVTSEDVLAQSKTQLVALLISLKTDADATPQEAGDGLLDATETLDAVDIPHTKDVLEQPAFNSERWHEWVMTQFTDDEMSDGAPICDGLRRIVESVIGPIAKVEVIGNTTPNDSNKGTATVVMGVTIDPVQLETHPSIGRQIYVEDIADCNKMNTPEEYLANPSATAATKAESRVYRKILRLKRIVSSEEKVAEKVHGTFTDTWTPENPIKDEQINVIDLVCKRANVNVFDFINSGRDHYEFIEQVTEHTAGVMLQHLNRIQRGDLTRPNGIGPYDSNWRVKNDDKREALTTERV